MWLIVFCMLACVLFSTCVCPTAYMCMLAVGVSVHWLCMICLFTNPLYTATVYALQTCVCAMTEWGSTMLCVFQIFPCKHECMAASYSIMPILCTTANCNMAHIPLMRCMLYNQTLCNCMLWLPCTRTASTMALINSSPLHAMWPSCHFDSITE
jgi:hypothetical protein